MLACRVRAAGHGSRASRLNVEGDASAALTWRYLVAILIFASLPASAAVSVRKSPPAVHYRTFDPAKPPAEIATNVPSEGAVTVCGFGFSAEPRYDVVSRERGADGNWSAVVSVSSVAVYVRLSVVVWTPKGVSPKLKAHEEGHRRLDEMMYKKLADDAAQAAGAAMDGHQFTGSGTTAAKAEANAIQTMFQQAGRNYLVQTSAINEEINRNYDSITSHGTNDILEAEAMKQAVARYENDHADVADPKTGN